MAYKILVIDDDPINGVAAVTAMKELGFDPILSTNVEEGIKILNDEDVLCVLTDMNMPLEKGGSINKDAGMVVIKECINRNIPSAVVTGGGIGHHGISCIKVMLPEPMFAINPVENFSLALGGEVGGTDKNTEAWKRAWDTLKPYAHSCVLQARQRLRELFGQPYNVKLFEGDK